MEASGEALPVATENVSSSEKEFVLGQAEGALHRWQDKAVRTQRINQALEDVRILTREEMDDLCHHGMISRPTGTVLAKCQRLLDHLDHLQTTVDKEDKAIRTAISELTLLIEREFGKFVNPAALVKGQFRLEDRSIELDSTTAAPPPTEALVPVQGINPITVTDSLLDGSVRCKSRKIFSGTWRSTLGSKHVIEIPDEKSTWTIYFQRWMNFAKFCKPVAGKEPEFNRSPAPSLSSIVARDHSDPEVCARCDKDLIMTPDHPNETSRPTAKFELPPLASEIVKTELYARGYMARPSVGHRAVIRRWVRRQLHRHCHKLDVRDVAFIANETPEQHQWPPTLGRHRGLTVANELRTLMIHASVSWFEEPSNAEQSIYYSCTSTSPSSIPMDEHMDNSESFSSTFDFEEFSYLSALTTPAHSPEVPQAANSEEVKIILAPKSPSDELIKRIPGYLSSSMSVAPTDAVLGRSSPLFIE